MSNLVTSPLPLPQSSDAKPFSRRMAAFILIALALVSFGVYANTLQNGFALDDIAIVRDNPHVKNLEWAEIWTTNYWPSEGGTKPDILYRPVTVWTYLANQAIAPGVEWAFHLVNVLLHVIVTLLSTILAWRIFSSRAVAILTGLMYAVHPIHTEVVANVVGRAELLSTLFSLAALLIFLPPVPLLNTRGPENRSMWHGWLAALCFLFALLCKETPVALLIAFPAMDLWRWLQWNAETRPRLIAWLSRQTLRYYVPMAVAFGVYMAMRIAACGFLRDLASIHSIVNPLVSATPLERLITPFALLAKYLQLTFWPSILLADYSAPSLMPTSNLMESLPLLGFLTSVLAGIAFIRSRKSAPQVGLAIILFALSYALVSNYLRIGTILGERLFYLPSLFVIMIVAYCMWTAYRAVPLASRSFARWPAVAVLLFICSAMSYRTIVRNTDWSSNVTLALATARDNPGSAKACYWAGTILTYYTDDKKLNEYSKVLFDRAIELYPQWGQSYFELAKASVRKKDLGNAIVFLALAAEREAGDSQIRGALRDIKYDLKHEDSSIYMPVVDKFAGDHPGNASAQLAYAVIYAANEDWKKSETAAWAAIHGKKGGLFHEAACELAMIDLNQGKTDEGLALMRQYEHNVPNIVGHYELAHTLLTLDYDKYPNAYMEAQVYAQKCREIDPAGAFVRSLDMELCTFRAAHPLADKAKAYPNSVAQGDRP